jgi:predicted ATP-grasp superfamily ATP-dependent carboligase
VATLALLQLALPANLAVTALALVAGRSPEVRPSYTVSRTVLLSGGKMTKALALARSFHAAGHRVVLVESARYRLTGHRFSRAVDAFHTVPEATDPDYAAALLEIVRAEGVDVYVPVCSPDSSRADAAAKELLAPHCEVLHPDPDVLRTLDDKDRFAAAAAELGLAVPDTHRVTDPEQVVAFDYAAGDPPYVLKSIPYDPVARLDLTPLPRPSAAATATLARSKPISADHPWILQSFVPGQEYCTHSTVRDGRIQVWACCESSAFQVNYAMVDKPEIEAWVRRFVGALGVTGQVSFDVIEDADGRVRAIECNPRTHSAITMFADHPDLARAYLDGLGPDEPAVVPRPGSRPTYWLYHELWRAIRRPWTAPERLAVVLRGRDAIFDPADPLPFLLVHHLQIPSLLLGALLTGREWVKIDFNIGKLVEPAGD